MPLLELVVFNDRLILPGQFHTEAWKRGVAGHLRNNNEDARNTLASLWEELKFLT